MLTVKNINKQILNQTILDQVSFTLEKGTVTGLVGKNGAGKTTLLKILAGVIDADNGEVFYEGQQTSFFPKVKQDMIFIPDSAQHLKSYTIKELASFYNTVYPAFDQERFHILIDTYKLPFKRRVRHLSKGTKTLLCILLAICTNAKLLLLDEPTNGLDPIIKRQVLKLLLEEVADRSVSLLISTHHLHEVEQIADHLIILEKGKIDTSVSLDEMKHQFKKVQVVFNKPFPDKISILPQVTILNESGRVITLLINEKCNKTLEFIKKEQPVFIEELPMTLEDIFVTKLGGEVHVS